MCNSLLSPWAEPKAESKGGGIGNASDSRHWRQGRIPAKILAMPARRKARPRRRRPVSGARREDEQLRLARAVQEALLPPPLTALPGVEVAARFQPSQSVGGDFYDYFPLHARYLAFYLGDVQGKGLEGAMYALLVSGLMRGLNKTGNEPAALVEFLNRRLALRALPGKFCALAYAVFDLEQRQLRLANAGLPFPWLLRHGQLTRVEIPGIPVGMFNPCQYDQGVVRLESGDRLLFYTDGLPDSLEALYPRAGDGEKQLARLLGESGTRSAAALADRLVGRLQLERPLRRRKRLEDDAAFLVVHIL